MMKMVKRVNKGKMKGDRKTVNKKNGGLGTMMRCCKCARLGLEGWRNNYLNLKMMKNSGT